MITKNHLDIIPYWTSSSFSSIFFSMLTRRTTIIFIFCLSFTLLSGGLSAENQSKTVPAKAASGINSDNSVQTGFINKLAKLKFLAITNKFITGDPELEQSFADNTRTNDFSTVTFIQVNSNKKEIQLNYLSKANRQQDSSVYSYVSKRAQSLINPDTISVLRRLGSFYEFNEYYFGSFSGLRISMKWE